MLVSVDLLLHRIEAVPEPRCYTVSLLLDATTERSVVMRVTDGEVQVPEANMVPGWSTTSDSFAAVAAAVLAFDAARTQAASEVEILRDVDGGWDVSIGNVVLNDAGRPACVAHGDLEPTESAILRCTECGAQALFGRAS
jgi:hypothetical protein